MKSRLHSTIILRTWCTRVKQHECFTTALINHIVSIESDTLSIALGSLYPHQPPVERSKVSCRAAGGDSVICCPSQKPDRQRGKLKNSPTPPLESYGPGCPTLGQGFCVRKKKDRMIALKTFFRNYLVQVKTIEIWGVQIILCNFILDTELCVSVVTISINLCSGQQRLQCNVLF